MYRSTFDIPKMDCPSEENLIRMKLSEHKITKLDFDLENRKLTVYHVSEIEPIESALAELNLGAKHNATDTIDNDVEPEDSKNQRTLLWTVLIINFSFFLVESLTGFFSRSMGLVADSLDMLADASVYALSLFAVGGSAIRKKNIAKAAGYFQIVLAIIGFLEVIRRFTGIEEVPEFKTMIIISSLALVANGFCLYLLQRSKSNEAHMKASMIFTSNDVIINLGVITAGTLVYFLRSSYPDLIIGTIVFVLVIIGAMRILSLGK